MRILCEFEVAEEELPLRYAVVAEEHEIHICNRRFWSQIPTDDLDNRLDIEVVPSNSILGTEEENADSRQATSDEELPPGQC